MCSTVTHLMALHAVLSSIVVAAAFHHVALLATNRRNRPHPHHLFDAQTSTSRLWAHQAGGKSNPRTDALQESNRREWLCSATTLLVPSVAFSGSASANSAGEEMDDQNQRMVFNQHPVAPLSVLLPVTEQRLLLRECLALSETLANIKNPGSEELAEATAEKDAAMQRLEAILLNPKSDEGGKYNYYTRGLTEKKRTERDLRIISEYQGNKTRKLSGNIVRAAMNIYITNLRYGREYTVEDPEWKSAYIRANGGLPDFRKLVQADLDLRILYMNQVQLRVDDAAAEFYAVKDDADCCDGAAFEELNRLLRLAEESMDAWFQLIDDADIAKALRMVIEGNTVKIADNS